MLVSVLMITYNHEKYIKQAIQSVLMQHTSFEYELIVANDCSTDDTDNIIQTYLESNKFTNKIKYYSHDENLGIQLNFQFAHSNAKGKYIAICEGDDYWTDPLKLQKQVNFLEANTNYSFCWTRFKTLDQNNQELTLDFNTKHFLKNEEVIDFDFEKSFKGWHIGTQTLVFRSAFFDIEKVRKFMYFRDVHLITQLLKKGKGACLNFVGAHYRIHDGGIHSTISTYDGYRMGYNCHKEIYLDNPKNFFLKKKYLHSFQNFINANVGESYLFNASWMSLKLFFTQGSILALLRNFKRILKKGLKL